MKALRFEFQSSEFLPAETAAQRTAKDQVWEAETWYLGRNGYGMCTGIAVDTFRKHTVGLTPFNSKGVETAACRIDLPAQPHLLRQLADILLDQALELELKASGPISRRN